MRRLTRLEFRELFTLVEKRAIYTAAKNVVDVQIWLDDLAVTEHVDLQDLRTIASVTALEAAGLLELGRAAAILQPLASAAQGGHGFTQGQRVRVLPPFNAVLPDVYEVEGFTPDAVLIAEGRSFAPNLLEKVDGSK